MTSTELLFFVVGACLLIAGLVLGFVTFVRWIFDRLHH